MTADDFHPDILRLFDLYVHGLLPRRDFLKGAARFTAAGISVEAVLDALNPRFAEATQIASDDTRLLTRRVNFDSPRGYGKVSAYLAEPTQQFSKRPVVLVVHENRGLNPHIEDIARRIALEGYIAVAPDALAPLGGYPGDEDKARELFATLDQEKTREDFIATANTLKRLSNSTGKLGVVGFCYGGSIASFLATRLPDLNAAVSFYGSAPVLEDVPNIKAPILIHHAEKDERLLAGWPKYEEALKAAGVYYAGYIYPNAQHGFNNDTTPRYDPAAAALAWQRTLDWFAQYLSGTAGDESAQAALR